MPARGTRRAKAPEHPWRQFLSANPVPAGPRMVTIEYGPADLGLRLDVVPHGGMIDFVKANPQLFATGTTSADEGDFYWALLQIRGPEGDEGGWLYQSGSADLNKSVVDFVILRPGMRDLGIRIQSAYRHLGAGAFKAATDAEQVYVLEGTMDVLDVWSEWYIGDTSGKTVLAVARDAIDGDPLSISPVLLGGA